MTGPETKRPRSDLTRPVRSEWAQVELGFSVSSGSDGEGVSVVGQDRPSGPDLAAFVAFEARSVHPVAAFEVADPAFGSGSVALQPSLGAPAAGLLAAGDEDPLGFRPCSSSAWRVGPGLNPPSSAISRGRIPSRVSSLIVSGSSVSSAGFPSRVEAGTINPRAPRRVCSVTSQIWLTYPNSLGLPSLPLRIGLASGSEIDTSRSVIGSPATRWRI